MTKSYFDHVKTGELKPAEALTAMHARNGGRHAVRAMVSTADKGGAEAAVFGALDAIAVHLVQWYGAANAAEVLTHYAGICARREQAQGEAKG